MVGGYGFIANSQTFLHQRQIKRDAAGAELTGQAFLLARRVCKTNHVRSLQFSMPGSKRRSGKIWGSAGNIGIKFVFDLARIAPEITLFWKTLLKLAKTRNILP